MYGKVESDYLSTTEWKARRKWVCTPNHDNFSLNDWIRIPASVSGQKNNDLEGSPLEDKKLTEEYADKEHREMLMEDFKKEPPVNTTSIEDKEDDKKSQVKILYDRLKKLVCDSCEEPNEKQTMVL